MGGNGIFDEDSLFLIFIYFRSLIDYLIECDVIVMEVVFWVMEYVIWKMEEVLCVVV